jgi:hypothetical protein
VVRAGANWQQSGPLLTARPSRSKRRQGTARLTPTAQARAGATGSRPKRAQRDGVAPLAPGRQLRRVQALAANSAPISPGRVHAGGISARPFDTSSSCAIVARRISSAGKELPGAGVVGSSGSRAGRLLGAGSDVPGVVNAQAADASNGLAFRYASARFGRRPVRFGRRPRQVGRSPPGANRSGDDRRTASRLGN